VKRSKSKINFEEKIWLPFGPTTRRTGFSDVWWQ